jgi:F-type H+-transporting ATPase subunit alpha
MDKSILIVSSAADTRIIDAARAGFSKKLGRAVEFDVVEDEKITGGFIAIIDGAVYDNSISSRLREAGRLISSPDDDERTPASFESIGDDLKSRIDSVESGAAEYKYGVVESLADDIVHVRGLSGCRYGELLDFEGGATGLTLDLRIDGVGAAILDGSVSVSGAAHPTGRVAEICVGGELLGRVVDPLGRPLDGRAIKSVKRRPIEAPAPTITQRAPVNTPLETGILTVDSMIPIGRGQRELIIGDRQTGKTSIAISTIINQAGRGVYCVYCAIGQKASTVSGVVHALERAGALSNTVVVAAFSSATAAMQYIAPYAACAVAEEFMYSGRDVVIVYDDLSKHAVAYRSMSLLLRRPSGREAYPGDVFYLHSRLLERAAHLSKDLGGGSMTALPIVETMAGDISAYIPTNVISITDGQIYLESELFNSGQRPAVNVGLSVSRVGRAAQHKAMRAVSGSMRLNVAQYRDMSVFAQFGADIDASTAQMLRGGERLMELLRQPADLIFSLSEQTAILLAYSDDVFAGFERGDIDAARARLLAYLWDNADRLMRGIDITGALTESDSAQLRCHFERFVASEGGESSGGTQ